MAIQKLINPKTDNYLRFKQYILSNDMPWYYEDSTIPCKTKQFDPSFFSHIFLKRPGDKEDTPEAKRYPTPVSKLLEPFESVIEEIIKVNNIDIHCIYRMNANLTQPLRHAKTSPPHVDHRDGFEHKNMLIYLTDAGGDTIVGKDRHSPKEDDIIVFGGEIHLHNFPLEKRRVVLVMTYAGT